MICSEISVNSPLVSICVPVFNVAPYIEQCARSLFTQTYSSLEFVFVNDASTDDSMQILQQVASDYPHLSIRYVENDRNHGLAYTRRRSIEEARGEYLCCVDSDDWVEVDMVECLMSVLKTQSSLMAESAYVRHMGVRKEVQMPIRYSSFEEVLCDLPCNNIWGKLFHRSLFADASVFAPEGMDFMEDRHVLTRIRYRCGSPACADRALYHYRVGRPDSVANHKSERHFRCMVRFYDELERWVDTLPERASYSEVLAQNKVWYKAFLLLNCADMAVVRRYADLYREEELHYLPTLHRSFWLVTVLVHFRQWWLVGLLFHIR